MKQFFPILVLVCSAWAQAALAQAGGDPRPTPAQPPAATSSSSSSTPQPQPAAQTASPSSAQAIGSTPGSTPNVPPDQENALKAKAVLNQAIQALGGQAYLTLHDREQQGKSYGFHHGRASGAGVVFWSFTEFPDKERVELTKERDVAELYVGNKAWELTYKGAHPIEEKDRVEYMRRRRFSLDNILRTWVNDPSVVLLFEGAAIAAQHPSQRVTLINGQDESVTLFVDSDTHLPVKKSFSWRDPVDKQKNLEEEVYENYRLVSGVMAPYNVTRFFNEDMASQRFLNSVTINQKLDPAMFDPNSGYDPNKAPGKQTSKR
jgi:hypothetical protein